MLTANGFVLCCLMTPRLSKEFGVMHDQNLFNSFKSPDQIRLTSVGCQPGDCRWLLNLSQQCVWVCMLNQSALCELTTKAYLRASAASSSLLKCFPMKRLAS